MKPHGAAERGAAGKFRPLGLIIAVTAAMLVVNLSVQGYSRAVLLPRYCGRIDQTLDYLESILTQPRPAADGERREYLIAAKLVFLMPQQAGEPDDAYLARLRSGLQEQCR